MKSILFYEIVKETAKDIHAMKKRYLRDVQNNINKEVNRLLEKDRINIFIQKAIKESVEKDQYFKELKKKLISRINLYITKESGNEMRKRIKEKFNLFSKEYYRELFSEKFEKELRKKVKEEVDKIEIKDLKVTTEEYRELARKIKEEILEELRDDLCEIKRRGR